MPSSFLPKPHWPRPPHGGVAVRLWLPCFAALLGCLLWDGAQALWGLDLWVSGQWAGVKGFAWATSDWARMAYKAQRWLAFCMLALVWTMVWLPRGPWRLVTRAERLWLALTVVLTVLTINALKHESLTSCPVELQPFGGKAAHVSHWAWGVVDGGFGRCFPSGHASGAFAFVAVAVFFWRHAPHFALRCGLGVVALGVLFGGLQVGRGEHFASHVLWCACICLWVATTAQAALRWWEKP